MTDIGRHRTQPLILPVYSDPDSSIAQPFFGYYEYYNPCTYAVDFNAFVLEYESDYVYIKSKCSATYTAVIEPLDIRRINETDITRLLFEDIVLQVPKRALRTSPFTFARSKISLNVSKSHTYIFIQKEWTFPDIDVELYRTTFVIKTPTLDLCKTSVYP